MIENVLIFPSCVLDRDDGKVKELTSYLNKFKITPLLR